MFNSKQIKKIFQKIQIVRSPKHRLATFGTSKIAYQLVTDVPGLPDRTKLRSGIITTEKPAIITPQTLKDQFHGFSDEAGRYVDSLFSIYGEALRGLEYHFKNEPLETRVELVPVPEFVKRRAKELDREGAYHHALILGSEKLWELSLMKFIIEETMTSFTSNLQELKDRGFFDENRAKQRQHREIQALFTKAKTNRQMVPVLGAKLKEYGLFEHYQDSFFQLINR